MSNLIVWLLAGLVIKAMNGHLGDDGLRFFFFAGVVSLVIDGFRLLRWWYEGSWYRK